LLKTLQRQSDIRAYLETFGKYAERLEFFTHEERSELERNAIIYSCRLGRPLKSSVLRSGEDIIVAGEARSRERIRKEACEEAN
jgi:hypothetical protein